MRATARHIEVVGAHGLAAGRIAQAVLDIGEGSDRGDAELCRQLGIAHGFLDVDPGRRRHVLDRDAGLRPIDQEDRPDQVGGGPACFRRTSRRDHCALRLRRRRTAGKAPTTRSVSPPPVAARSSGAARRWARVLASGFIGHLCLSAAEHGPANLWASARPTQGAEIGSTRLADLGVLEPLGHVEVEMVLVGIVGFGAQHRIEEGAGGAVGGAQEFHPVAGKGRRLGPPRRLGGASPRPEPGMILGQAGRQYRHAGNDHHAGAQEEGSVCGSLGGRRLRCWPCRSRLEPSRRPPWQRPPARPAGGPSGPNPRRPRPPGRGR